MGLKTNHHIAPDTLPDTSAFSVAFDATLPNDHKIVCCPILNKGGH